MTDQSPVSPVTDEQAKCVEGVRELLAEHDFDEIGGIYNADVRTIIGAYDAAVGALRAARTRQAAVLALCDEAWLAGITGADRVVPVARIRAALAAAVPTEGNPE